MAISKKTTHAALSSFGIACANFATSAIKTDEIFAALKLNMLHALKSGASQKDLDKTFKMNYVMVRCSIPSNAALVILENKRVWTKTAKPGDDLRTEKEQQACGTASKIISRLKEAAGVKTESKQGGARHGTSKNKAATAAKEEAKAGVVLAETIDPVPLAKVSIPRAKGVENVREFAELMAATVSKFMKANGDVSFDVYGGIFETFVASVKNAKVEQASKASANVATPAPIVNLNVVRDDAAINALAKVKHSGVSDFIATQPKARKSRGN